MNWVWIPPSVFTVLLWMWCQSRIPTGRTTGSLPFALRIVPGVGRVVDELGDVAVALEEVDGGVLYRLQGLAAQGRAAAGDAEFDRLIGEEIGGDDEFGVGDLEAEVDGFLAGREPGEEQEEPKSSLRRDAYHLPKYKTFLAERQPVGESRH